MIKEKYICDDNLNDTNILKIVIITPMEVEQEKVLFALSKLNDLENEYKVVVSGIGRESMAKAFIQLPVHDICVLVGFAAIVGNANSLPHYLQLGKPIEISNASLYGYEGGVFENGAPIEVNPKLDLPHLSSLTSDKFIKTTDLSIGTVVNMEDYTFMYLKKEQDFIVRIISDFLPHETEIDFFEEVKKIDFMDAVFAIERNIKKQTHNFMYSG